MNVVNIIIIIIIIILVTEEHHKRSIQCQNKYINK